MITEIGIVAGEIWHHLDEHGRVNLQTLAKGLDRPREWVLMSMGWLAREGHVLVRQSGADYDVELREKPKHS